MTTANGRLRIGLVAAGGFDESGEERVTPTLLSLAERIAERHDLTIYVLRYHDRPRTYSLAGATVRDLGRPNGLRAQYAALRSAVTRHGEPPQILHAYFGFPPGLVAALVGRRHRIPTIVTMDSGEFVSIDAADYGLQRTWKRRRAVALTVALSTQVTVCTAYQARLAERLGYASRVIPLGVDAGVFVPGHAPAAPPWRLLHVASLNRVKDQATLFKAMVHLRERLRDFHLDIVGEDVGSGDIPDLASRLGLSSHVTFHGFQPVRSLVPLFQRSHLLVMSSLHEAACAAVLEAASCGVATAGTSVGYISDWAADGRAIAAAPGDSAGLALAIAELLQNPLRRLEVAERARGWATAHDANWTAGEFNQLYQSLASP